MENIVDLEGNRKSLSRFQNQAQQQPGQYLCVDTRKESEYVETASHQLTPTFAKKGSHYLAKKKQLTAAHGSGVQPDSLCKLKTILAINYIQDILETDHLVSAQKSSKNLKKHHLKPLLVVNQLIEPPFTRCLGIQNDRRKKTLLLGHGIQLPLEAISPASTRFSSANKAALQKDAPLNVDLRRLSLADQNSIEMDDELLTKNVGMELTPCKPNQGGDCEINNLANGNQVRKQENDYCNVKCDPQKYDYVCNNYDIDDGRDIDHIKLNSYNDHGNFKNSGKEFPYIYKDSNNSNVADNYQEYFKKNDLRTTDKSSAGHTLTSKRMMPTMRNSTKPHVPLLTPGLDSIQVKDIWKALTDSGLDISREEVSRYKAKTGNAPVRIKSAPVRQGNSQTHYSSKADRVRSAYGAHPAYSMGGRSFTNEYSQKYNVLVNECDADQNCNVATKQPKMGLFPFTMENSTEKSGQDSSSRENLEVLASSKPFSKLPSRPKNIGRSLEAPLTFKINTRPTVGCFFYFAYGLNMNHQRLEIQLRHKIGERYWGLLFGFKLIFNKKGSCEGGVGFPNIVAKSGFSVEGCIYELPSGSLQLLDTCIGFPKHYARLVLPVWMCNSLNPHELGVAQHCVPAVVYVAQDDWVVSEPKMLDSSFTFKQCLLGTDLLTPNYQEFLSLLMKK